MWPFLTWSGQERLSPATSGRPLAFSDCRVLGQLKLICRAQGSLTWPLGAGNVLASAQKGILPIAEHPLRGGKG